MIMRLLCLLGKKIKIKSYGDTKNTNFQGKQKKQKKIHNTHVCLWYC